MNILTTSFRRLTACILLVAAIGGSAAAQGNDKLIVIKKNVSIPFGSPNTEVHYLKHVKVGDDWVLQDAQTFDPATCLWYTGSNYNRAGTNHNYYFIDETTGKPHFLSAPMTSGGTLSLSDDKPVTYALSNTDLNYFFYDWDKKGLARGHQVAGIASSAECSYDFEDGECWEVYWVEYDLTASQWKLTNDHSYGITDNSARSYDVTVTEHPVEITGTPEGGLTALTVDNSEMTYPSNQTPRATVSNYEYTHVPAYTTYSFSEITTEADASNSWTYTYTDRSFHFSDMGAGVPASTNGNAAASSYKWTLTGDGARFLSFASDSEELESSSTSAPTIYYRAENTTGHKTATLTLSVTFGTGSSAVTMTRSVDITVKTGCKNPAQASAPVVTFEGTTVTWYATANKYKVEWKKDNQAWSAASQAEVEGTNSYIITGLDYNATYNYRVTAYCIDSYLSAPDSPTGTFTTTAEPKLLVYGAVFGGGRMANVAGNTEVIIINCDSISAVYGGNDIAGAVQGGIGSTITLGVNAGDTYSSAYNSNAASTKVNVGSVYGGGNGYYAYNGTSFVAADNDHTSQTVAVSGTVNAMTQQHSVGAAAWTNTGANSVTLNIPAIVKTAITVTNDNVKIDSLFGGAKNAFITLDDANANGSSITINGGTIYSVFGGNNFGGTQKSAKHHIDVAGTKTYLSPNVDNNSANSYGRTFGIRYLFGGGNKVAGSTTEITVTGGQIDTLFGGGNSADVAAANVTVNCNLANGSSYNTFGSTYTYAFDSYSGTITPKNDYAWNGTGIYNVRTLFGGNNAAAMYGLPSVILTSGSAGTVYGGGNAGDMKAQIADAGGTNGVIADDFDRSVVSSTPQQIYYGTHVVMNNNNMLVDNLYGGCQKSNVDYSTWVEITGGHIGTVYGGCNISGDVGSIPRFANYSGQAKDEYQCTKGATYVKASGGTIYKNVFAGSNGFYHCNDAVRYVSGIDYDDEEHYYIGDTIPSHNETHILVSGSVLIKGDVYAGGNMAPVGFINESSLNYKYNTFVGYASLRMNGGRVNGSVYGGGRMASIYGSNEVVVSAGKIDGALYGGNDRAGQVAQISNRVLPDGRDLASDGETHLNALGVNTYVEIIGRPDINTVYGGGNGAYKYSGPEADMVYCDPTDQPIQTNTFVDINIEGFKTDPNVDDGGHIETVYGGGNGVTVTGGITVLLNVQGNNGAAPEAYNHVGTIFGGNNQGNLALVPDIILLNGQVSTVYGGCNQGAMVGSTTVTSGDNTYNNVGSLVHLRDTYRGIGSNVDQTVSAKVSDNVYGGCKMNGVTNNTLVLVDGGTHTCNLFGGSDISGEISGISQVIVNDGTVANAYGGGNGNYTYDNGDVYNGAVDPNNLIATGVSNPPSSANTNVIITGGTAANLFGGGKAAGAVNTTITMDGGTVTTGIYGGSESAGDISGDVLVNINAGTVGADGDPADGIFGGGYGASTTTAGNVTVNIGNADSTAANDARPILYSDVYGGSALGTVNDATSDLTTVNIINGTVNGNIYGGGLGAATLDGNGFIDLITQAAVVNGNVQVNIGLSTQTSVLANGYYNYVTINGKVFGCNNLAGSPKGSVNVDVYHTAHTTSPDNRYPTGEITIDNIPNQAAYAIAEVYGGGNLAAYAPTAGSGVYIAPVVHIHNCDNTIELVYGGGNAALVPATNVIIDGGRFDYIFAGGNGAGTGNPGANITDDVTLTINGGIASYVFGGSNTKGTIGGDKNITIDKVGSCIDPTILNFFAGGNRAEGTGGTINITNCGFRVVNFYGGANMAPTTGDVTTNIYGGTYHNIFGGSNAADINGNVTVNFYGGTVTNIFGGNNAKGQISGNIVVNVIKNGQYCSDFSVDNVYGGGKDARYGCANNNDSTHNGYPQVNILHTGDSQINYDVFGGGLGEGAQIWGRPTVTVGGTAKITIGENQVDRVVTVGRNVYGGGSAAQVNGNTDVSIIGNSTINGNVYGGGNEAVVTGNTDVKIGD